ncbi:MAG: ABC transporter substrate-binding protein [Dehalococcoidia bacterium]
MKRNPRSRLLATLALGAALTLGMACSSSNNNSTANSAATRAATQAASAAATKGAATVASTSAPAGSPTRAATSASTGSPVAAASSTAAATGGNIAVPKSVVDADKAIAAAAGTGSPVDSVTISKPVTIEFWHVQPNGPNGDKLNALIKDFQAKNPNITVNAQYVGNYTALTQKIQTGIAGGQLPDLANAYENDVSSYQDANVLIPLDDYVKSKTYGLAKDDYADILQGYRYDSFYANLGNKMFSFPFTKSVEMMFYNADALKAAGISGPPQTWDDFIKAGKAFTKPELRAWAMGTNVDFFFQGVLSRGGQLISDDYKKWLFNSQQAQDNLAVWQQALKEGWGYPVAKAFDDQVDFGNGKAVFTFSSSAGLPYYQKAVDKGGKFTWSATTPPHAAGRDPLTIMYGGNVAVFKSTPEKQLAAWLFIKYFTSKEVNPDWASTSGYLPIRASGLQDPRIQAAIKKVPAYAEAVKAQNVGVPGPPIAAVAATRQHVTDMEVALFSDPTKNIKQLLDDAVNQSNKDLSKYR